MPPILTGHRSLLDINDTFWDEVEKATDKNAAGNVYVGSWRQGEDGTREPDPEGEFAAIAFLRTGANIRWSRYVTWGRAFALKPPGLIRFDGFGRHPGYDLPPRYLGRERAVTRKRAEEIRKAIWKNGRRIQVGYTHSRIEDAEIVAYRNRHHRPGLSYYETVKMMVNDPGLDGAPIGLPTPLLENVILFPALARRMSEFTGLEPV